jgi:hypothetical protein
MPCCGERFGTMAADVAGATGDEYSCHFVKLAVRLLEDMKSTD